MYGKNNYLICSQVTVGYPRSSTLPSKKKQGATGEYYSVNTVTNSVSYGSPEGNSSYVPASDYYKPQISPMTQAQLTAAGYWNDTLKVSS